jgi:hypothetical protein
LYKGKDEKELAMAQTGWRKFLILRYKTLKYIGLGLLWLGSSIAIVITNGSLTMLPIIGYGLGLFGLLIYILSSIWPFVAKNR